MSGEIVYNLMHVDQIGKPDKGKNWGSETEVSAYVNNRPITFRDLQKDYGRCTGKVYVDKKDGTTLHVGYVFIRRVRFSGGFHNDSFIQESWVTFIGWDKNIDHCTN